MVDSEPSCGAGGFGFVRRFGKAGAPSTGCGSRLPSTLVSVNKASAAVDLVVAGLDNDRHIAHQAVQNVDIVPTLLDYLGIDGGELPMQSGSIRPYLNGVAPAEAPPVFVEVDFIPVRTSRTLGPVHKKAVVVGRHKLVRDDASGKLELYDLFDDPHETNDLYEARPELSAELLETLERSLAFAASGAFVPVTVTHDEEQIEALRKLGYVGD